jgi:signal transduction histidine kinase/ActR/RegA family two-component response regulator
MNLHAEHSMDHDSGWFKDAASNSDPSAYSHWRVLASISGLGALRIDRSEGSVSLDISACTQHGLSCFAGRRLDLLAWISLFSEADQLRLHAFVTSPLKVEQTDSTTARLMRSAEGETSTLELSLRMEPDGVSLMGVCRDVTAAQSLEEIRRQRMAADRANQAKSEFMSQVSHELRTPLNSILGFAQLMAMEADQPLCSKQLQRLQMLQKSGLRLLALVDQLLQIGKIEQGKLSLRPRSVNARALVQGCVDAMSPMAQEHGIEMRVVAAADKVVGVRADPHALEQVLINLLSNAIKYNREGGSITVTCRLSKRAEIWVEDTGPGLSPSQVMRLFEPFNRMDARRNTVQGTGLGLVISRQLVEAMDGTLDVSSEVGVGSCFKVALPRSRNVRYADLQTLALDVSSNSSRTDGLSVLYIEDDPVNVMILEQLFANQPQWQLTVETTGLDGLVAAVQRQPDLILLDLTLSDMTGWEVLKRLRLDHRTRDIQVIAVSADAMPASQRRSRARGFADYWTKPLDLQAAINKLNAMSSLVIHR